MHKYTGVTHFAIVEFCEAVRLQFTWVQNYVTDNELSNLVIIDYVMKKTNTALNRDKNKYWCF